MRSNLGIRRRLAPLLANDRQRIELANSILFSLPGSPVIYYGDEIGMGDNIFLEDRRGLRTPMQWGDTRSAGFSDADPSQLYFPLIADETYGYHRVNVAAQRADPDSLLNHMRTMLAVRKANPAFGRGDFTMLLPRQHRNPRLPAQLPGHDPALRSTTCRPNPRTANSISASLPARPRWISSPGSA